VLVLNATYEPINVCTVRRAVVLLLKEKAEVVEQTERQLHSATTTLTRPAVIRLVTYVKVPRDTHRRKITRRAVFARDDWTCQYCGSRTQLNIVAACAPCNRRKGDALPRQAGMTLARSPRTPNPDIFIQVASPTIPATWKQYLSSGATDSLAA
jgi:5-methylcytosine-specific restriction endonuclease McrA